MFGKIVYYDKKTIDEYKTIINGKPNLEIGEYDITSNKEVNADLKLLGGDVKGTKSYKAKVQESDLLDCEQFEKMLSGRDDFLILRSLRILIFLQSQTVRLLKWMDILRYQKILIW